MAWLGKPTPMPGKGEEKETKTLRHPILNMDLPDNSHQVKKNMKYVINMQRTI